MDVLHTSTSSAKTIRWSCRTSICSVVIRRPLSNGHRFDYNVNHPRMFQNVSANDGSFAGVTGVFRPHPSLPLLTPLPPSALSSTRGSDFCALENVVGFRQGFKYSIFPAHRSCVIETPVWIWPVSSMPRTQRSL